MKRFLFSLAIVLALSSCTSVYNIGGDKVWVYDSYWNLVMKSTAANAKDMQVFDSGDIASKVAEFNAAHTDMQLFVEAEETPIEESPDATVYIVDAVTHEILKGFVAVPRTSFTENASLWDLEARADGGVMYVDVVPPPPLPLDPTYKYFLYLIASDGRILFSEQCTPDLFGYMLSAYNLEAYNHPGSHVVHGELYNG